MILMIVTMSKNVEIEFSNFIQKIKFMSEIPATELNKNSEKESNFSIQEVLSIGYIFLIIVGMYLEFVKYNVFGINIIEHSDFADFLIAPFKNPTLIIVPIIGGFLTLLLNYYYEKRKFQKKKILNEESKTFQNTDKTTTLNPPSNVDYKSVIIILILMFTFFNIGFGISGYFSNYGRMERNLNSKITNANVKFIDGSEKKVYLLGKNTSNLFYFENNKIDLIVCPIPGNVKSIKYIPEDQQKQLEKIK